MNKRIAVELQKRDTVRNSLNNMTQMFKEDPDFAWVWHCNIAMPIYDECSDHTTANRAAARVMQTVFGVDTSLQFPERFR